MSKFLKITLSFLAGIGLSYAIGAEVEITPIHRLSLTTEENIERITFNQKVFGNLEKTEQYELSLHRMCVIHPYHPTGSSDAAHKEYFGVPTYLFMAQKPAIEILKESPSLEKYVEIVGDNLSCLIQRIAQTNTTNMPEIFNNLQIGICVQNAPWKNETLLLRPHYAVFDSQPNIARAAVDQRKDIKSLILSPEGYKLEKQLDMVSLVDFNISVHTSRDSLQVISSPHNMKINGLQVNSTTYLWSFVADGNKFYFTMHWLLTDRDFKQLNMRQIDSLEGLMHELSNFSQTTFPEYILESKPYYAQLKYILEYLKSTYSLSEYSQLSEVEQNHLLKYACDLVNLGKYAPDSSCLNKALQYLKANKEMPILSNILNYHLSRNVEKFTRLTKRQREVLLREAGILVSNGKANRDTNALTQALGLLTNVE